MIFNRKLKGILLNTMNAHNNDTHKVIGDESSKEFYGEPFWRNFDVIVTIIV